MGSIRFWSLVCLPAVAHCALPEGWVPRCDIPKWSVDTDGPLNREALEARKIPLLIKGVTKDWVALKTWDKDNLLRLHGDVPFHTDPWHGNTSLKTMLDGSRSWSTNYYMGHVVGYGDCYERGGREFSPFLQTRAQLDYQIEEWMKPMKVFQIGLGIGDAIGVPPENHPSAWFAVVKGVKRWVLTPGDRANTQGQGTPKDDTAPPAALQRPGCEVGKLAEGAFVCDQEPGDIMWVPWYTWHETCGLEEYNIGVGGVTYDGADNPREFSRCTRKGEFTEEQMERAKQICNGCLDAINTEAQLSGTANTTNTAECMKSTQLEWCGNPQHKSKPYGEHMQRYDSSRFRSSTPEIKTGLFTDGSITFSESPDSEHHDESNEASEDEPPPDDAHEIEDAVEFTDVDGDTSTLKLQHGGPRPRLSWFVGQELLADDIRTLSWRDGTVSTADNQDLVAKLVDPPPGEGRDVLLQRLYAMCQQAEVEIETDVDIPQDSDVDIPQEAEQPSEEVGSTNTILRGGVNFDDDNDGDSPGGANGEADSKDQQTHQEL